MSIDSGFNSSNSKGIIGSFKYYFSDAERETAKEIGNQIKKTAEESSTSSDAICKNTRIRKIDIESIMDGEIDNFESRTYYVGRVRTIVNYLNMDCNTILDLASSIEFIREEEAMAKKRANNKQDKTDALFNNIKSQINISKGKHLYIKITIVLVVLGALIFVISTLSNKGNKGPDSNYSESVNSSDELDIESEYIEVPKEEIDIFEETNEGSNINDNVDPISSEDQFTITEWPVTAKTSRIKLVITEDSWVRLYNGDSGNIYIDTVAKKGQDIEVKDVDNLKLSVGNGSGVSIELDGEQYTIGRKGQVVKGILLSEKALAQRFGM